MTVLRVVELWCSLCVQVTIVIACAAYLARRVVQEDRCRDRLWTVCLLAVLLTTISGLCLPHLRILPTAAARLDPQVGLQIERHVGWLMAILAAWGIGAFFMLGALPPVRVRLAAAERSKRYSRGSLAGAVGNDASGNWFYGLSGARSHHSLPVGRTSFQSVLLAVATADDRTARDGLGFLARRNRGGHSPRVGSFALRTSFVAVSATDRGGRLLVSSRGTLGRTTSGGRPRVRRGSACRPDARGSGRAAARFVAPDAT